MNWLDSKATPPKKIYQKEKGKNSSNGTKGSFVISIFDEQAAGWSRLKQVGAGGSRLEQMGASLTNN